MVYRRMIPSKEMTGVMKDEACPETGQTRSALMAATWFERCVEGEALTSTST
jgi:hypothetical protein